MAGEGCGLPPCLLSFVTIHQGNRKFSKQIDLQPRTGNIWADQPAAILFCESARIERIHACIVLHNSELVIFCGEFLPASKIGRLFIYRH